MLSEKNLSVKSTRVSDLLTIRDNYKKHAETFRTIARARKNVVPRVKEAARDFGAYLVRIEDIDTDRFNLCVENLDKHFAEYNTDAEARRVAKQYIEDINRRIEYGIKNRCAALVQDQLDNRGIITDVEARAILENVRDYCANFDDVRGGFEVEVRDAKKCYTCRVWSNDTRRKIIVNTSTGAGIMNEGQVEYLKSNGYTGDEVLEANLTRKTLDAAFYVGSITSAARRVVELQYFSVENQPAAETVEPVKVETETVETVEPVKVETETVETVEPVKVENPVERDLFVVRKTIDNLSKVASNLPDDVLTARKTALDALRLAEYALKQRDLWNKKRGISSIHFAAAYGAVNHPLHGTRENIENRIRVIVKALEFCKARLEKELSKNQPVENPVENQPVENQPVENQPVENQPVENQPVENQPVENPDDVLTEEEKAFLNKIDWNKSDAVPAMLARSISAGACAWIKPWFSYANTRRKFFDGSRYSLGNSIRLMLQGASEDFYITRTEARRILGKDAAPKKGARPYKVVKPRVIGQKTLTKDELDALRRREYVAPRMKSDDELSEKEKKYNGCMKFEVEPVYHQGAFEGLEYKRTEPLYKTDNERNALADKVLNDFCAANNITFCVLAGCDQAYCESKKFDEDGPITIVVPPISDHKSAADYYSTVFHEATHAANRRNHCKLTTRREELAAEIGSCIVLNTLGFKASEYIENSAAYIKGWKGVVNEKNAIVKAWKYAQAASDLILASFFEMQKNAIVATSETVEPVENQPVEPVKVETVEYTAELEEIIEAVERYRKTVKRLSYCGLSQNICDVAKIDRDGANIRIKRARENGAIPSAILDELQNDFDEIVKKHAALVTPKQDPKPKENALAERTNADGSTSYISNGVEIMRDITNAN